MLWVMLLLLLSSPWMAATALESSPYVMTYCRPEDNGSFDNLTCSDSLWQIERPVKPYLLETESFSASLWIKNLTTTHSVLGVVSPSALVAEGCSRYHLDITVGASDIEINFSQFTSCLTLTLPKNNRNSIMHLGIVFDPYELSVYLDNLVVIEKVPQSIYVDEWKDDAILEMRRPVYQAELFGRALTRSEIEELYRQGLQTDTRPPPKPANLVAVPSAATTLQGQATTLVLSGYDHSELGLDLSIRVDRLPKHGKGWSWTAENSLQPIYKGAILAVTSNASVFYTPDDLYFNSPQRDIQGVRVHEPDTLTFSLVGMDVFGTVLVESEPVPSTISVTHTHYPMNLTVPSSSPSSQDTLQALWSDNGKIARILPDTLLEIESSNMEFVHVDIRAPRGVVSLHPFYRSWARYPQDCQLRFQSDWRCVNDGIRDKIATFLAAPSDLRYLLSNIEYKPSREGTNDTVSIRIYDGVAGVRDQEGDQCLTQDEHYLYNGVRTLFAHGCTEYAIDVEVPIWEAKERPLLSFIDKQFFYFWVGFVIVLSSLCLFLYNAYPSLFHPLICCYGVAWLVKQCRSRACWCQLCWTKTKNDMEASKDLDGHAEVPAKGEGGSSDSNGVPSLAGGMVSSVSSLDVDSLQPDSDGISSSVHQSDTAADEFSLVSL